MSRHERCKVRKNDFTTKMPVSIPVSIKRVPTGIIIEVKKVANAVTELQKDMVAESEATTGIIIKVKKVANAVAELQKDMVAGSEATTGIIIEVKKVANAVTELQKDMVAESEARNNLQKSVEKLIADNAVGRRQANQSNPLNVMRVYTKMLPCKTIIVLDELLAFIKTEIRSSKLIEYIKLLGGGDFNESIKISFNAIMDRSVLKQLSWTGFRTTKPSLKSKYKALLDCVHVAMSEKFKDYTIALGEAKIKSLL